MCIIKFFCVDTYYAWNGIYLFLARDFFTSNRIDVLSFSFSTALLLLLWQIFLTTRAVEALYEAEISTNFLATLKLRRRIISLISSSFLIIFFYLMKLLESRLVFYTCLSYLYRCMDNIKLISHNRLEDTDVQKRTRRRIKWKDSNDPSFPPDTLPSRKYGKLNIWPPPFNFITQSCYTKCIFFTRLNFPPYMCLPLSLFIVPIFG